MKVGDLTMTAWTVEYGEAAMDGSGGFPPVENGGGYGGNGGDGKVPEDYQDDGGDDGDDGDDYILSEGMDCDRKRQVVQYRTEKLLQHAFVITGKDSWAGCKGFLDSWVVYGTQTKTKTTNKCTVPYEDNLGNLNPKWENDPCCNWMKRQHQCCAPREVEELITVVDDVNEDNIALFSAATGSGTLALDLAMTYASAETEAAKSCFGPYKAFMDATNDVWKVVDECRVAVEGAWSETYQVQLGSKCTSHIDCYTGECYAPVSNNRGKTPDEMEVPNWGAATLTCLIDKSIPELKGRLAIRLQLPGKSTAAELAAKFLAEPGMQRAECRGHDNPWNRLTEESCMAPKQCNFDGAVSNETQCLNPCEEGGVSCSSYCGQGDWEVSELPFCLPRAKSTAINAWLRVSKCLLQRRVVAAPAAPMHEFSPQQILRLCTHFHRAFLKKDKARVVHLAHELIRHRHLLRSAEVSMTLNHFAQLRILDHDLWNAFSDALMEAYIEPDPKALGLAANAYARAMLQHPVLNFVAREVEALAKKKEMEARNVAMVVNGFSKLRLRDSNLMTAISEQLTFTAHELNAVDLATVANGYARLWLHESEVFDAMKDPMMKALPDFSVQNLAMLAHAYGRFFRRDYDLLEAMSVELKKRCDLGQAVPAANLGSIVHAYASRLQFFPTEFLQVLDFSLPRVAEQMELPDTILTLAALKNIPKDEAIFKRCLEQTPKLSSSGIVCAMEAALHLQYFSERFWTQTSRRGLGLLMSERWDLKLMTSLIFLLAELQGYQDAPELDIKFLKMAGTKLRGMEELSTLEPETLKDVMSAVLVLISYDAISEVRHVEYDKDASEGAAVFKSAALRQMMIEHTRGSGVFALIMFPVYFLVATQHQFRFIHTCIFWIIPLAMACFWTQLCGRKGYNCNLYLSMASKMMLCLICMLHSTMAWFSWRPVPLLWLRNLTAVYESDVSRNYEILKEAELAKQRAKEAKAEAKEKKGGERKRKGKTEDVVEKTEKPEKKKKTAPKASKDGDGSAGREADEVDPGQLRKAAADAAFAKLKAAGIPEFEAAELGATKKSFSIAPANKQGSTIGVVLYSESFYVYDAVSPERWESEVGTSYKVNSKDGVTVNWYGRGGKSALAKANVDAVPFSESELITTAWHHAKLIGGWAMDQEAVM
eukprot:symbB.v1.2.012850.t1/scaffold894.1/size156229/3